VTRDKKKCSNPISNLCNTISFGLKIECRNVTGYKIQPTADRVPQNLKIIPETFQTKQNSAHGIYD